MKPETRKKHHIAAGFLAVFLLILLLGLLTVLGFRSGILYTKPSVPPGDTVTAFFDAVVSGDRDTAVSFLAEGDLPLPDVSVPAQKLLADSFHYSLSEEPQTEKLHAVQNVSFTFFDFTLLEGLADAPLYDYLSDWVENHPKKEIYDADRRYLPEVMAEAVDTVFAELLSVPSQYYREVTIPAALDYYDGAWHITLPEAFFGALSGNTGISDVGLYLDALKQKAADSAPYIRKTYSLPADCTVAPAPDPACYGATTDPEVILSVIDAAAELLDGQSVVWTPDIELFPGAEFHYYFDDTILVITWQEWIDEKCCTCAEVKIADASQLMRKIVNDHYNDGAMLYCSDLAAQTNAVFASNSDFYYFRQFGIVVYQGVLYRCETGSLDTCFFDRSGNMHLVPAGTFSSRADVESYLADNDIRFSLAFGPSLIENGAFVYPDVYPVGQINTRYSRAAIGMTDDLHYLFMTVNFSLNATVTTATLPQIAEFMLQKGCITAYGLDGGQTSELYMDGAPLNYIDWDIERRVSDIICFGTAIPESDR